MSLIIAQQDVSNLSHSPASFDNIIHNAFTIKKGSKIGLKSAELNITPVINIVRDRNDKFSVLLGNETPTTANDLKFADNNEKVPTSKLRLSSQLLYLIQLDEGSYTREDFISEIENKINLYFNHQSFKNKIQITQSINASGESNSLIFSYPSQNLLPASTNPVLATNPVYIYNDAEGAFNYGSSEFSGLTNGKWVGLETEKPIHPAGGEFNVTLPATSANTEFIIGLKRNTNEGKNDEYGLFDIDEDTFPVDDLVDDDNEDIYFDYMIYFDGTNVRLYNLIADDSRTTYEYKEVEYWNTAVYGGSSSEVAILDKGKIGTNQFTFRVVNENIEVGFDGNVISSEQLKCSNNNTSSLYGKLYIKPSDVTKDDFSIDKSHFNLDWIKTKINKVGNDFNIIQDGFDYWTNQLTAFFNNNNDYIHYKSREVYVEADYWAGRYQGNVNQQIQTLVNSTDELPCGLWIKAPTRNGTIDAGGTYLKYNQNQTPFFLFYAGRQGINFSNLQVESRVDLNFTNVILSALGFDNYRNLSNDSIDWIIQLEKINALRNIYVRLNNFGNNVSVNGGAKMVSKIISEIDISNTTGVTYYSPNNIIYIDLQNTTDFNINSINIDIVDEKERLISYLENGTSIILHLIQ